MHGLAAFLALLGVAGCASSGASLVPTPVGTATPTPGHCATLPGAAGTSTGSVPCPVSSPVFSTLSINSNPAGLAVTLNGAALGTTPVNTTPTFAPSTATYAIAPSNGSATFTYTFQQNDSGNVSVYYNQAADSPGSIGLVSPTSVSRRTKLLRSWAAYAHSK